MRHLWSSLAGLLVAPLVWVLVALGQGGSLRLVDMWNRDATFETSHLIGPAGYLAAAGILLGLLATLRVSPAGPLIAGALLVAPYALMFADPFTVRDAVPADRKVFGETLDLSRPLDNGTVLLLGVLLLMAVFSAQRWRRWPAPAGEPAAEAPAPEDQEAAPPATDAPVTAGRAPQERPEAVPGPGERTPAGDRPTEPSPAATGESPWLAPPRTAQRERTPD